MAGDDRHQSGKRGEKGRRERWAEGQREGQVNLGRHGKGGGIGGGTIYVRKQAICERVSGSKLSTILEIWSQLHQYLFSFPSQHMI